MFGKAWVLIKDTVSGFLADEALSRGAAIAYYTVFSVAPLLLIVIAIAGLAFGHEAAQKAIVGQLGGLMGQQTADTLQTMLQNASNKSAGTLATIIGVVTLLITASGAFGEIQSSLNAVWKAEPKTGLSRLVRARIASLGLVMTLGFLMLASLAISAGLTALDTYLAGLFPAAHLLIAALNFAISLVLISVLFAAIYKILPDKDIEWRDVAVGAVVTALLFTIGKSLIGLYIGSSSTASSYGAAGALIVLLLWIYYTAQIFLMGAEFTRAYAERHGSMAAQPAAGSAATTKPTGRRGQMADRDPATTPPLGPDSLAEGAAATRRELHETWDVMRARTDAWQPGARRPSWFQIAVAGVASFALARDRGRGETGR
ncbi:MAG: YihY/virulence factor BrkB family protein [Alphaproteobacteria bacterium]|nr:YihY/virulence factor BrkB family protein [Alphaproteobacteria bacterium]